MERATTPRPDPAGAGAWRELAAASGLPLESFRDEHVRERVDRAIAADGLGGHDDLAGRLRVDADARARFRRSVAVSHSGLFRDAEQFDALEHRVLPPLLEHVSRVRVWSAGCANGLELWSLAVVLDRLGVLEQAELLGTDLLEENVAVARSGPCDAVEIAARLHARPRWQRHDLVAEAAPAGHWNLVLCRNVAIYLRPEAKARVHRTLAEALAPGGVLVIGRAERLSDPAALGLGRVEPQVYQRLR